MAFLFMPRDPNHRGRFEPVHEAHAIEQVVFIVQFERPLDDDSFSAARKIAERFKSELPGVAEIQSFALTFGGPGAVGPTPSGPSAGSVFHRVRPDGAIESELRVERASVTFRTSLYSRWDDVWTQARRYFDAILPTYAERVRMSAMGLNYVDKFLWAGEIAECQPSLLLRPQSSYVCPHVFAAQDLWHSHTGAFLRVGEKIKRLLNINVDCVDENRPNGLQRTVSITTVLTDFMNQPGYAASEVQANEVSKFIEIQMRNLHEFGKQVFSSIINDEMCKRIALTD